MIEKEDVGVLMKLFHHNTWANLKLLDFCENLSDEQLDTSTQGCYGSIRETLMHIANSEVDYVNLATEKHPEFLLPTDQFAGFDALKKSVRWAGKEFLQLASTARADTIVRVTRPHEPVYEYPLASFIVQVLNHSTEHRTHVSTIITQLGIDPPVMSGWKYMREMGEFREFK